MVRGFACPECGAEVSPQGLSPGRQVCCPNCLTWVEVPFIPRQVARKRPGPQGWQARFTAGLIVLAIVAAVVALAGVGIWKGRQAQLRRGVDDRVAASEALEKQGRLGLALKKVDEALVVARDHSITPSAGIDALRVRRDGLARRLVDAQLDALLDDGSDSSLADALDLLARVDRDPALESLKNEVRERFGRIRDRWAEVHLAQARAALDAGRFGEVLALGEAMTMRVAAFPPGTAADVPEEIRSLAGRVIGRAGVVILPIQGRFLLGSAASYDTALRPLVADSLRRSGYLAPPASSPFLPLWGTLAPYRLTVTIEERQTTPYLQTPHRSSEIETSLTLSRGGSPVWSERLTVRTRVPLPMASSVDLRRFSVRTKRDPEIERRLYDDARAVLVEKLVQRLQGLPKTDAAAGGRP
jgi:hypothetical protein